MSTLMYPSASLEMANRSSRRGLGPVAPAALPAARRMRSPRLGDDWYAPPAASTAIRWSGGAFRQSTPAGALAALTAWSRSSVSTTSGLLRMVDPNDADNDG